MPGKVVSHNQPSSETQALREFAAPTGFMGMAQYQALRRQARRQLLASSWKDVDEQEKAKEAPQGG